WVPLADTWRRLSNDSLPRGDGSDVYEVAGRLANQRMPRVHGDKKWQLLDALSEASGKQLMLIIWWIIIGGEVPTWPNDWPEMTRMCWHIWDA
ncbi:hypothetical protein Tco_1119327, partial [Tanacetum coccineum]